MQPSSTPTPLIQKLIAVILLLILGCLAVLLARSFRADSRSAIAGDGDALRAGPDALTRARNDKGARLVPPWTTNASRTFPTNRLTFQPARTASSSGQSDALPSTSTDTPVTAVIPPLPARIVDARTAVVVDDELGASGELASVTGRITLRGQPPPEIVIDMGPSCGPLNRKPVTTRHYVVSSEGDLANVFVLVHKSKINDSNASVSVMDKPISEALESNVSPLSGSILLDQKGCMFEPYVTAMQLTQSLRVRNSDMVLHNVHLTPRRSKEINFGQPAKGQVNTIRISTPESFVRLKCDVHPWMFAFVSVVPHRFFAVTASNGVYRIPAGLPSGDYMVTAAHLKLGQRSTEVTIRNGSAAHVDFEFSAPESLSRQTVGRPRL